MPLHFIPNFLEDLELRVSFVSLFHFPRIQTEVSSEYLSHLWITFYQQLLLSLMLVHIHHPYDCLSPSRITALITLIYRYPLPVSATLLFQAMPFLSNDQSVHHSSRTWLSSSLHQWLFNTHWAWLEVAHTHAQYLDSKGNYPLQKPLQINLCI